jgi:hypothetical protein
MSRKIQELSKVDTALPSTSGANPLKDAVVVELGQEEIEIVDSNRAELVALAKSLAATNH